MKWYLYPLGNEFNSWARGRIQKALPENFALQAQEPEAAIILGDYRLLPLTDLGSNPAEGEVLDSRSVVVDLENNTAEVEYTYRNKTQQEISEDLAMWRAGAKVSRFQARAALQAANLLTTVENAVLAYDEDDADFVQLVWYEAQEWRRNSPTIATLAAIVNLSDEDLDNLFIAAKEIEA